MHRIQLITMLGISSTVFLGKNNGYSLVYIFIKLMLIGYNEYFIDKLSFDKLHWKICNLKLKNHTINTLKQHKLQFTIKFKEWILRENSI